MSSCIKPGRWYSIDATLYAFPSHLPMNQLSIHVDMLVGEWKKEKYINLLKTPKHLKNYSASLVCSKLMAL